MKRITNKRFMDFKTCNRNSLFHFKHCGLSECSSRELVSIALSSLFSHGYMYSLQNEGCVV